MGEGGAGEKEREWGASGLVVAGWVGGTGRVENGQGFRPVVLTPPLMLTKGLFSFSAHVQ